MENNDYIEFEGVRRYQPDALHKRMLARIAELEAQLQGCLVQVDEDEDLHCRFDSEGITVKTMYSGTAFLLYGYAGDVVHLPAGYYIAKVQPAAKTQP